MLHTPPHDEIIELREIAHDYLERGKEENFHWLMALSDRLQQYRLDSIHAAELQNERMEWIKKADRYYAALESITKTEDAMSIFQIARRAIDPD